MFFSKTAAGIPIRCTDKSRSRENVNLVVVVTHFQQVDRNKSEPN